MTARLQENQSLICSLQLASTSTTPACKKINNNNNNASSIAHAHRHHRSVRARGNRMVIKKMKETKQRQMNDIVEV